MVALDNAIQNSKGEQQGNGSTEIKHFHLKETGSCPIQAIPHSLIAGNMVSRERKHHGTAGKT